MKLITLVLCQENGQLKFRVIPKLMVQCVIYFCLKFRGGQIPTSPVNSNGIIKRFYVFEDNRLSMVNVGDFVKIKCENGQLIISLNEEKTQEKAAEKAFMDEEMKKLRKRYQREKEEICAIYVAEGKAGYGA